MFGAPYNKVRFGTKKSERLFRRIDLDANDFSIGNIKTEKFFSLRTQQSSIVIVRERCDVAEGANQSTSPGCRAARR